MVAHLNYTDTLASASALSAVGFLGLFFRGFRRRLSVNFAENAQAGPMPSQQYDT